MSAGLIITIVVVVVIVVIVALIAWAVGAYNNLVTLKNRVKNGWAQIDVQLKQRRPDPESGEHRQRLCHP